MALFSLPPCPLEQSLSHISEFNPQPGVENPDGDLEERFQAMGACLGHALIAAKARSYETECEPRGDSALCNQR